MILNKVIENKRDTYMINVLEESTSELESLKTKKYLTENLNLIGKILMEEGVVDNARQHLANNWGKYATGAGVAGAVGVGAGVANHYGAFDTPTFDPMDASALRTSAATALANGQINTQQFDAVNNEATMRAGNENNVVQIAQDEANGVPNQYTAGEDPKTFSSGNAADVLNNSKLGGSDGLTSGQSAAAIAQKNATSFGANTSVSGMDYLNNSKF